MTKKRIILICFILVFSMLLTGCKKDDSPKRIAEKTTKELGYFV